MRRLLAIVLLAGLATPVWAQTESVSARPDRTTLVIYRFHPIDTSRALEDLREREQWGASRDGLAMIVETRTVEVPAGAFAIAGLLLKYHRVGGSLYAIGGNLEAARSAGIQPG